MMTKKNYIEAVKLIRSSNESKKVKETLTETFKKFFSVDNSRFDHIRFISACLEKEHE